MEIQKLFYEVRNSFPNIKSGLISFKKESFMESSPLTGRIYYNKNQLEKFNFSKKALIGALAHELSHQVDYKRKGFLSRLLFKKKYKRNLKFKEESEKNADRIAVQRGFGNELIQLIKESEQKFPKSRFENKIKPFHLTIKEIKDLMKKQR
jgi:hypothetical protein